MTDDEFEVVATKAPLEGHVGGTLGRWVLLSPDERDALVAEVRRLRALVPLEGATVLVPVDPKLCYECRQFVFEGDGEQHGRSGWVHYSCLEAASP